MPSISEQLKLGVSDSRDQHFGQDWLQEEQKFVALDLNLCPFPGADKPNKIVCFVDAAYVVMVLKAKKIYYNWLRLNNICEAIVYRSKAQLFAALISTETEIIAFVTAAKTARYIRSVVVEPGFAQ